MTSWFFLILISILLLVRGFKPGMSSKINALGHIVLIFFETLVCHSIELWLPLILKRLVNLDIAKIELEEHDFGPIVAKILVLLLFFFPTNWFVGLFETNLETFFVNFLLVFFSFVFVACVAYLPPKTFSNLLPTTTTYYYHHYYYYYHY